MLTTDEALLSLATATASATVDALRSLAGDEVELGAVSLVHHGRDPLAGIEFPAAVARATFVDGGGRMLVMPMAVAQRLTGGEGAEPSNTEASDLADTLRPTFEAAAGAAGAALEIELAVADVEVQMARSARDVKTSSTRATLAEVSIFGSPCVLIGLVSADIVARVSQDDAGAQDEDVRAALDTTLRDVPLRVWAEVGRARLRSAEVASLGDGAIIELDRAAEDPVDLYVNGSRIGTGRLVCIDGKEWAVRLEEVFRSAEAVSAAA